MIAVALVLISYLNRICAFSSQAHRNFIGNAQRPPRRAPSVNLNAEASTSIPSGDSPPPPRVLCVGEALFDSLPTGIYLGGAPTNVAVHLASLFESSPESPRPTVAVAACLGNDQLGREAHRRLAMKGVQVDHIQFHPEWETGMATAVIDENGDATYEFNTPAAWDGLILNDLLLGSIECGGGEQSTEVFIMGTIAGRLQNDHGATSFATLTAIRNSAAEGTVVLDVNLRSPWYTPEAVLQLARGVSDGEIESSAEGSSKKSALVKLNEDELSILEEWCGLNVSNSDVDDKNHALTGAILKNRMGQLSESLNTQRMCVTRGKDGAALLCIDKNDGVEFYETSGFSMAVNIDSDTVGAGDSFLAALVASLLIQRDSPERALERACALGGYVAGCRGATPAHSDAPDDLRGVFSLN